MTVAAGIAEIRASRKLVLLGADPFRWRIRNTAGDGTHELEYAPELEEIICLTCTANYQSSRCWARQRVIDDLEQRFGKGRPPKAPETPEEAIGSMSWRDVFKAAQGGRV